VIGIGTVVAVAAPFVWLGMVLAISGLEAPLKFRAPGITVSLGLGIGRLVFRALNICEVILAVLLAASGLATGLPLSCWLLLGGLFGLLAVQMLLLRRGLDRRTQELLAGHELPRSHRHRVYIGLEVVKVVALTSLGSVLVVSGVS
jgi:hypothetical protein